MGYREEFWYECDGCGERYYDPERWLMHVEYKGEVLHVCRGSDACTQTAKEEFDNHPVVDAGELAGERQRGSP